MVINEMFAIPSEQASLQRPSSARCAAERAPEPYAMLRSEGVREDGRIDFAAADHYRAWPLTGKA